MCHKVFQSSLPVPDFPRYKNQCVAEAKIKEVYLTWYTFETSKSDDLSW